MNFFRTFKEPLDECRKEYERHYPAKKNSFQEMSSGQLFALVDDAYADFYAKVGDDNTAAVNQSFDLINLLLMFAIVQCRETKVSDIKIGSKTK